MMKVIVSLISSVVLGMLFTNSSPVAGLQKILDMRRRIFYALGLGLLAAVFALAGVLTGSIQIAVQYEEQGFVILNPMLWLAMGFFIFGMVCFFAAKVTFPDLTPQPTLFSVLGEAGQKPLQFIETFLKDFLEGASKAEASPLPPLRTPDEERIWREGAVH